MVQHSHEGEQSPSRLARMAQATRHFLRQLAQQPVGFLAFWVVVLYLALTLVGSFLAPYAFDTIQSDPAQCVTRANGQTRCAALQNAPPSAQYPFGTDRNGRDVFSRVLHGARFTIGLPIIATFFAVSLGTFIGLGTGYIGGALDEIVSRVFDSLLSIPTLVLALVTLSTVVPTLQSNANPFVMSVGATNIALIIVITLLYTPIVARVIRSATLGLRDRGYVEIAKLRGESTLYILLNEILPSVIPALAVEASLRFSYAIFLVASLGFLGLGAQPPIPEWGRLVLDARATASTAPHALWFPIIAIATLIISVNLLSDALQRLLRTSNNTQ